MILGAQFMATKYIVLGLALVLVVNDQAFLCRICFLSHSFGRHGHSENCSAHYCIFHAHQMVHAGNESGLYLMALRDYMQRNQRVKG